MSNSPHIRLTQVSHSYPTGIGVLNVLSDIELSVPQGSFLSVIGPSGCGKTTLLKLMGGLLSPVSGEVSIGDNRPKFMQERKRIGFVFQDSSLLPWRSVERNITLPLEINGRGTHEDSSRDLIRSVGLEEFRDTYPHQLSGGMRQRVALARALATNPEVLLLDEPLGSLDEVTRTIMRYEVLRIWSDTSQTTVMVTHSIPEAIIMSDVVVTLSSRPGRVIGSVPIDLPRPRTDDMEDSSVFLKSASEIRQMLFGTGLRGKDV